MEYTATNSLIRRFSSHLSHALASTSSIHSTGLIGPLNGPDTDRDAECSHLTGNTAAGVYLNGIVLFVAGLAVVQNHHYWKGQWPLLITLVGWGDLALGLTRMVAPEKILAATKDASPTQIMILAGMLLPIGILLTLKGFF